jgi:hypothetical protein
MVNFGGVKTSAEGLKLLAEWIINDAEKGDLASLKNNVKSARKKLVLIEVNM